MKPRWLLLGVSVLCLLVLFPASALSQQQRAELRATCGSASVDGVMSPGEWDHAGVVQMSTSTTTAIDTILTDLGLEGSEWDVSLAQPATVTGWLYAMNDESHLYLAQLINLDSVVADPLYWNGVGQLLFMDEPDALDGDWEAANCGPPLPGEGQYLLIEVQQGALHQTTEIFLPVAQGGVPCFPPISPIPGVNWAMGPGSLLAEWEIDLNASDVDEVGPGECLLISESSSGFVCRQGTDCANMSNWVGGGAAWPQYAGGPLLPAGTLCLDPCEVEFVPEPGTILLLGSGLMGLAGYAGLRWRRRE